MNQNCVGFTEVVGILVWLLMSPLVQTLSQASRLSTSRSQWGPHIIFNFFTDEDRGSDVSCDLPESVGHLEPSAGRVAEGLAWSGPPSARSGAHALHWGLVPQWWQSTTGNSSPDSQTQMWSSQVSTLSHRWTCALVERPHREVGIAVLFPDLARNGRVTKSNYKNMATFCWKEFRDCLCWCVRTTRTVP